MRMSFSSDLCDHDQKYVFVHKGFACTEGELQGPVEVVCEKDKT